MNTPETDTFASELRQLADRQLQRTFRRYLRAGGIVFGLSDLSTVLGAVMSNVTAHYHSFIANQLWSADAILSGIVGVIGTITWIGLYVSYKIWEDDTFR